MHVLQKGQAHSGMQRHTEVCTHTRIPSFQLAATIYCVWQATPSTNFHAIQIGSQDDLAYLGSGSGEV